MADITGRTLFDTTRVLALPEAAPTLVTHGHSIEIPAGAGSVIPEYVAVFFDLTAGRTPRQAPLKTGWEHLIRQGVQTRLVLLHPEHRGISKKSATACKPSAVELTCSAACCCTSTNWGA